MSVQATSIGGWTCPACKAWVQNGAMHSCSNPVWQNPPQVFDPAHARIAAALERIAAALEAGKEEGS